MPNHWSRIIGSLLFTFLLVPVWAQETEQTTDLSTPAAKEAEMSVQEENKELARRFYEQVWFSNNTDAVFDLVANEYVVHDTGDIKGVTEPAKEQKNIADFFHSNGDMTGSIDYQIAEGDMVATRWQWKFKSKSLLFTILGGGTDQQIPIINVFRFKDGKIVEIWNHRHDIDTAVANFKIVWGFVFGFLPAAIIALIFFVLWRRALNASPGSDSDVSA